MGFPLVLNPLVTHRGRKEMSSESREVCPVSGQTAGGNPHKEHSTVAPLGSTPMPQPTSYKTYSLEDLASCDGEDGRPLLLALNGVVYDVSTGAKHYGKGGGYRLFAGKDASRCLAKGSLSEADIPTSTIDNLSDLTADEKHTLDGWVKMFSKYTIVGSLVGYEDAAVAADPTHQSSGTIFGAAGSGNLESLKQLLIENKEIDPKSNFDDKGASALHLAAENGHISCVQELLKAGIKIDTPHLASNETALFGAARGNHGNVIKSLLENGANVEAKDSMGYDALMHACMKGSDKAIVELIEAGAQPEFADSEGWTCLHWAAAKNQTISIETLLATCKDLKINIQDTSGNTALHWAGRYGHVDSFNLLISKGAIKTIYNNQKLLPTLAKNTKEQVDCVIS
eukprot:CFRG3870T1